MTTEGSPTPPSSFIYNPPQALHPSLSIPVPIHIKMHWQNILSLPLLAQSIISPKETSNSQTCCTSCPHLHIFGARETLAAPGYGLSYPLINALLDAYPDPGKSTAEAIDYPACGGPDRASCGGATHPESVAAGIDAASLAINVFHERCPQTRIVLVGYSMVVSS
jgi:acetylxylan esterase